ncbi:cation-transporting P-type ATPase [Achromobacter deleyi]|uniref:cation-transporting P-type ATPase n=1 Tax=Achromobacter deleyi TaxID=1353891 RepID=UPI0014921ADF|nr:cation-transporting P-type ATPase [Achromobacter deleyi]QVQ26534.1 cation-transporting P-type ATPase [Achromobacter deleyi]UIP22107.1 cation-transporting P-type ATPase [Achromobacter deleyi]
MTHANTQAPQAPQPWHQLSVDDTLGLQVTSPSGLSQDQIRRRQETFGLNALPPPVRRSAWLRFLAHFNDVLIYILLGAAVVTALMGHWLDTAVILAVAIINAIIGHVQESRAERSLDGIRDMLSNHARVVRDGQKEEIDARDLVPGDIVILRPGDKIPADVRLFDTHNFRVEESMLTGESTVVEKHDAPLPGDVPLGDRLNLGFSGTHVSAGNARGVVIATGSDTEIGHINRMMSEVQTLQTPLLRQMDQLGKRIFQVVLVMVAVLFLVGRYQLGMPLPDLLLSLISIAVAAVPEGLPAIISIILSLGVQRMARNRAIIRKLPTVETLGAMTVICSDKTGTLTMNEMTAKNVLLAQGAYRVAGDTYQPVGEIARESDGLPVDWRHEDALTRFVRASAICNDSQLHEDADGQWRIVGGPTEGAMMVLAAKAGQGLDGVDKLGKVPFDSSYKYMARRCNDHGQNLIYVTGAPDVLFQLCAQEQGEHGPQALRREYWESGLQTFAHQGLRTLAAAYKPGVAGATALDHPDLQEGLILLGIAGIMDPPRPEAIEAIAHCNQAGIRVKMITGDHPETALAIGAMLGMTYTSEAITGAQLQHISDQELAVLARDHDIFARTSPEHKLRLVRALQSLGEVVGMTGDGVNDAPALKQADVGVAMGIKGTEVTKEAADMVLADDNFASIAYAVREGRRVYDNLKKTILFILPTNLAQALLVITAILAGALTPLSPLQILWMNMATSTTLSFGLAFEPGEPGMMHRPPRTPGKSILDGFAIWRIAFVGILFTTTAFIIEKSLVAAGREPDFIRTVILQTLVTAQWTYLLNCRLQDRFSLTLSMFRNKALWLVTIALGLLQCAVIYLPWMNRVFGTVPLPPEYWTLTLVAAGVLFVIVEIEKLILRTWRARHARPVLADRPAA